MGNGLFIKKRQAHHCYCIYQLTAKGISRTVFGVYETFMPKTHSFSKLLLCIGHNNIDFLGEKNNSPKTMNDIGIPN